MITIILIVFVCLAILSRRAGRAKEYSRCVDRHVYKKKIR